MSSVMPFTFNAVELCLYRGLTGHCNLENIALKYQMSIVPSKVTLVDCPKDLQRCNIYINEEGMYELLFSRQQAKAKEVPQEVLLQCVISPCLTATYKQDEGR